MPLFNEGLAFRWVNLVSGGSIRKDVYSFYLNDYLPSTDYGYY